LRQAMPMRAIDQACMVNEDEVFHQSRSGG
jgi:hypothetical protein